MEKPVRVPALNDLSGGVIGAAVDVHEVLGPGLLESAYEECLCRELSLRNIPYGRHLPRIAGSPQSTMNILRDLRVSAVKISSKDHDRVWDFDHKDGTTVKQGFAYTFDATR